MEIVIKLDATEAFELVSVCKKERKKQDDMYKALSWALNCLVHGKCGPMPSEAVDIAGLYDNKNQIYWTPINKIMEGM